MAAATNTIPNLAGATPVEWKPKYNPWLIALTVTLATFMEVLDTSIANVALPHIAGDLGAGQDESTWVLTSYLVSNAVVLPLSAWLSSVFGRKNFYMGCVALFTLSSFLCGIAPSLGVLVLCRVLQGVGGGGLQPSEQAILADTFKPAQRAMAFAVYGIAVVTAPAIGPTLGGWITDNFDWRWIFFINIPVGILSIVLTSRIVEDPPHLRRAKGAIKVDYIGVGLLALGLGFLQVMLDKGEREDWFGSPFIIASFAIAIVGLIAAVLWEVTVDKPAVDFSLYRERNFAVSNVLMFMLGFVLLASTVLLPQFAQTVLGYSATDAGLVISPGGVEIMFLMPLVGILLGKVKVQPRFMIAFGLCITAAALFSMTGFTLGVDYRTLVYARMFQAAGLAFLFVPINSSAYGYVPRDKNNNASALINLARNVGGSFGIAMVTTLLARRTQYHHSVLGAHIDPGSEAYRRALDAMTNLLRANHSSLADAQLQAQQMLYNNLNRQAAVLAFVDCFWILAVVFTCMIPLAFFLKKPNTSGGPAPVH